MTRPRAIWLTVVAAALVATFAIHARYASDLALAAEHAAQGSTVIGIRFASFVAPTPFVSGSPGWSGMSITEPR